MSCAENGGTLASKNLALSYVIKKKKKKKEEGRGGNRERSKGFVFRAEEREES